MANGHGGKREGAGGKPGMKHRFDKDLRARFEAGEFTEPAQVIHDIMAGAIQEGDDKMALQAARELMPYAYPRLSATEITPAPPGDITIQVNVPGEVPSV